VTVTVTYCGLVAVFAEPALRLVYGAEFVPAATVTRLIALQYVLISISFGFGQAVKAAGRMRQLWVGRVVSAVLSITAVIVLSVEFGLVGAGVASVTSGLAFSTGVLVVHHRMRRVGDTKVREPA
jgi:O-antigen/teichoic acid export membrane protein